MDKNLGKLKFHLKTQCVKKLYHHTTIYPTSPHLYTFLEFVLLHTKQRRKARHSIVITKVPQQCNVVPYYFQCSLLAAISQFSVVIRQKVQLTGWDNGVIRCVMRRGADTNFYQVVLLSFPYNVAEMDNVMHSV